MLNQFYISFYMLASDELVNLQINKIWSIFPISPTCWDFGIKRISFFFSSNLWDILQLFMFSLNDIGENMTRLYG